MPKKIKSKKNKRDPWRMTMEQQAIIELSQKLNKAIDRITVLEVLLERKIISSDPQEDAVDE